MRLGRLEVSGGALLAAALLYYLDDSGITLWVLLAALLHELGHLGAIYALGGQVSRMRLGLTGAELRLSVAHPLSEGRMVPAALAGPAVNLLLTLGSAFLAHRGAGEQLYFFAGLNLGLALFNLLPIGWLDGGRALKSGCAALGHEELGRTLIEGFTLLLPLLLLLAGAVLLWESGGKNFTLLIAGLWMAWAGQKQDGTSFPSYASRIV